jgi:RNA polymerase sigma factor (sigma-70 family)
MPSSPSRPPASAGDRHDAAAGGAELPLHRWTLDDERLARLAEGGDERAFTIIYERYHQRLYRYCFSILHDGEDAYDALQSTLANALAALRRGQRDAPLRPWLFRIAHNETISLIRRRPSEQGPPDAAEPCAPSAEDRAGERARLELLVSDLQQLPERQRTVLLMRELSGLSHKDIASALGISVHTVGHAMLAARRSLGEFEEGREMMCEAVQRTISNANGRIPPRARAHLRDCSACTEFAVAIPALRADLQALAPPLAPAVALSLLAWLHGAASTHGAGGGGFTAAGLSGKAAGAALIAKAVTGVAIAAVASAGVTGAIKLTGAGSPARAAKVARAKAAHDGHRHRLAHASRTHRSSAQASSGAGASADRQSAGDNVGAGPASTRPSGDVPLVPGAGAATKTGTAPARSDGAHPGGGRSGTERRHGSSGDSPGARRSPVAVAHAHSADEPTAGAHAPASGQHGERSDTPRSGAPSGTAGTPRTGGEAEGASAGHEHEAQPPAATSGEAAAPAAAQHASGEGARSGQHGSTEASPTAGA